MTPHPPLPERRPLTRARILAAARARVDQEGLESLTMRRLGCDLGVEAMALYHHFPSKEALLRGLFEDLLEAVEVPAEGPWEPRLITAAWSYRERALAHRSLLSRLRLGGAGSEALLGLKDRLLRVLLEAGFPPAEAARALWWVLCFLDGASLGLDEDPGPIDPDRFPSLGACRGHLTPDQAKAHFAHGLQRLMEDLRRQLRGFPLRPGRLDP